ncbi:MAG: hypothetical protein RLZZ546_3366 [Bacteroidota bacterium]|jgi:hypothetical protein
MKKILLSILLLNSLLLMGQERYLNQVFNETTRNTVIFGKNYTVLAVPTLGKTIGQPLVADVYSPKGDTETKRPLVIYFHTGNFLPFPQNTSASGTIRDSVCVDICRKFAQMGYVAASADYRTGWNPIAPSQEGRVGTLINAAYRGVQDARTAIRYFKANATLFGIDTTKIILYGQGTGGYISLAAASLDKFSEVVTTKFGENKFISSTGRPFVIEKIALPNGGVLYINGDVEGKFLGIVPPNPDGTPNPGPPATGDTLCFPNHVNQTSDFALAVNMGGALGDLSWLDGNTPPIISIQCPYDPFAPYDDAVLNVPIPGGQLPVVRVQGSLAVQKKMTELGKNDIFTQLDPAKDPIGSAIKARQGGLTNLYPIQGTPQFVPLDSSPWDFWDPATNPNHANAVQGNPDMSAEKGRRYIDSILMFVAPRACIALDLPCKASVVSNTKDLSDLDVNLSLSPNPSSDKIRISVNKETPIKNIQLSDITGRIVRKEVVNSNYFDLNKDQLINGLYFINLEFEKGNLVKKIIFE